MGRFLGFIFKLMMLVVFLILCTAAAVIFDGLNDQGDKADVALVTNGSADGTAALHGVLDRVVAMHRSEEITSVLVIGPEWAGARPGQVDAAAMTKYLEERGIPAGDILSSSRGGTMQETARVAAEVIRGRGFKSVMIVADYYDVTRFKLALTHAGITYVQKMHVGSVDRADAVPIARSVYALYQYVGTVFLLPEAEEVKKEAKVGLDKASVDAEKAKEKVNKDLDNLPK